MKNLILACLIYFFSLTIAIAGEGSPSQKKYGDFSWTPSYNVSVGGQMESMSSGQGFVQFTVFLLKDTQLDYANLVGVGVSLDTNAKTYLTLDPVTFSIGHISVIQPVIEFPITGNSVKLGLAVGYFF